MVFEQSESHSEYDLETLLIKKDSFRSLTLMDGGEGRPAAGGWAAHLVEENVENAADEREWQRSGEQREEPAARVHGRVEGMRRKVAMQVGQQLLQKVKVRGER